MPRAPVSHDARSSLLYIAAPEDLRELVNIAAIHRVPGREGVTQIVKAKVLDTLSFRQSSNFLPRAAVRLLRTVLAENIRSLFLPAMSKDRVPNLDQRPSGSFRIAILEYASLEV